MRKVFAPLILILSLFIGVPVFAGGSDGGGGVNTQSFRWTTDEATTTSAEWEDVPGLWGLHVFLDPAFGDPSVSAQVSLVLDRGGVPVDIRIIGGRSAIDPKTRRPFIVEGKTLRPGPVSLGRGWPLAGAEAFSFTFVRAAIPPTNLALLSVQWRSPTGAPITMLKGTVTVLSDPAPPPPPILSASSSP